MRSAYLPRLIIGLSILLGIVAGTPAIYGQANADPAEEEQTTQNTGQEEDIGRFMGYEPVLERYLSLPYDVFMGVNWSSAFLSFGFILALFLPVILLLGRNAQWQTSLIFIVLLGAGLIFSVSSAFLQRFRVDHATAITNLTRDLQAREDVKEIQHVNHLVKLQILRLTEKVHPFISRYTGERDRITYPLLFGGFLVLLLLVLRRFRAEDLPMQSILLLWFYYFFLWLVLSGGIPWYGILIYPLGVFLVVYGVTRMSGVREGLNKWPVYLLYGATILWLVMFFALRFTGFSPMPEIRGKLPHYPEIINYQIGEYTAERAIEALYPQAQKAASALNADNTAMIYGIGTFMPFFVERSDQRIYSDPYLDFFNRLLDEYPDKNVLARTLRDYGFQYIILDIKLPTIDLTEEKTLTRKFERFLTFIHQNQHIDLVATDQLVKLDRDGSQTFDIGLYEPHTIVRPGRFAVYRLF